MSKCPKCNQKIKEGNSISYLSAEDKLELIKIGIIIIVGYVVIKALIVGGSY